MSIQSDLVKDALVCDISFMFHFRLFCASDVCTGYHMAVDSMRPEDTGISLLEGTMAVSPES